MAIYHVQYNDGTGWQGINCGKISEYSYVIADNVKQAIEQVRYDIADKICDDQHQEFMNARIYNTEELPHWQQNYEQSGKYKYRVCEIIADGHGNVTKTEYKEY